MIYESVWQYAYIIYISNIQAFYYFILLLIHSLKRLTGYPEQPDGDGDCVYFFKGQQWNKWLDGSCDIPHTYVCELSEYNM